MTGAILQEFVGKAGQAFGEFQQNSARIGQFLSDVFAGHSESIWFKSDTGSFPGIIASEAQQLQTNRGWSPIARGWNPNQVSMSFSSLFNISPNAVRVPEDRKLETQAVHRGGTNVNSNGEGLLNYLYHAKNALNFGSSDDPYTIVQTAFSEITSGYSFNIVPDTETVHPTHVEVRLLFRPPSGPWFPATEVGYGLRQVLLLLYFAVQKTSPIVCIEEPESHVHPEMQSRLAGFLRSQSDKQFFISSHSNVWLRQGVANRVFSTRYENGHIVLSDSTSRAASLSELGYDVVDNLVSDILVLTEGPTDIAVLRSFLDRRGVLKRSIVRFLTLGGDNMEHVDLAPLVEGKNVFALVDSDPKSERVRRKFLRQCADLSVSVTQLSKGAIENYFTVDALRSVFGSQIDDSVTEILPNKSVASQIGLDPKRKNWNVAEAMSETDISDSDLLNFLNAVTKAADDRNPSVAG